jgi:hypothetical protein
MEFRLLHGLLSILANLFLELLHLLICFVSLLVSIESSKNHVELAKVLLEA